MRLDACTYLGLTTSEVKLPGVAVSYTRYEPLQEQPWHVHVNPTFFVHLYGEVVDGSPEADWTQARLTATFHPADQYHRCRIGETSVCGLNLEITDAWLAEFGIVSRRLGKQRILNTIGLRDAGLRAFADLFLAPSNPADLEDIVFDIIEPFVEEKAPPRESGAPWMKRAEDRLHDDFRSPITLRDLAEDAAVHPVYFARAFRARHGANVGEYLQKLRLHCAADLVLGGTPLGEAAAEAGFADPLSRRSLGP
jgi:AraC-like DNA-binding protein